MKRIWMVACLVWLLPHMAFAATVTQETLKALSVAPSAWKSLLSSDTQGWKRGKIGDAALRFTIEGDVIGYDAHNRVWWRLVTPVSTSLPITALALSVNSSGVVTRQIVTLETDEAVISSVKEDVVQRPVVRKYDDRITVSTSLATQVSDTQRRYPMVKTLPQKAMAEELSENSPQEVYAAAKAVSQDVTASKLLKEPKRVPVADKQGIKNDAITVTSTWDFMAEYQKMIAREE